MVFSAWTPLVRLTNSYADKALARWLTELEKSIVVKSRRVTNQNDNVALLCHGGVFFLALVSMALNGLSGMVLWGHGLHIGWAITSGRLAGRHVARRDGKQ